ncbi:uncharacterized protein LOC144223082 isoform X2 [Crocuta crocuta]
MLGPKRTDFWGARSTPCIHGCGVRSLVVRSRCPAEACSPSGHLSHVPALHQKSSLPWRKTCPGSQPPAPPQAPAVPGTHSASALDSDGSMPSAHTDTSALPLHRQRCFPVTQGCFNTTGRLQMK